MNNALCGKTIENAFNRLNRELVNDFYRYIKLVDNTNFKYAAESDYGMVAVHKTRGNVKFCIFKYIGFVILEKVKLFKYKAIYDYFEKVLDCSYHYTDTDSIFVKLSMPLDINIETEMNEIKGILRNAELCKMKDELCSTTKVMKAPRYSYRSLFLKSKGILLYYY